MRIERKYRSWTVEIELEPDEVEELLEGLDGLVNPICSVVRRRLIQEWHG